LVLGVHFFIELGGRIKLTLEWLDLVFVSFALVAMEIGNFHVRSWGESRLSFWRLWQGVLVLKGWGWDMLNGYGFCWAFSLCLKRRLLGFVFFNVLVFWSLLSKLRR
jgi:hypothetical protein